MDMLIIRQTLIFPYAHIDLRSQQNFTPLISKRIDRVTGQTQPWNRIFSKAFWSIFGIIMHYQTNMCALILRSAKFALWQFAYIAGQFQFGAGSQFEQARPGQAKRWPQILQDKIEYTKPINPHTDKITWNDIRLMAQTAFFHILLHCFLQLCRLTALFWHDSCRVIALCHFFSNEFIYA